MHFQSAPDQYPGTAILLSLGPSESTLKSFSASITSVLMNTHWRGEVDSEMSMNRCLNSKMDRHQLCFIQVCAKSSKHQQEINNYLLHNHFISFSKQKRRLVQCSLNFFFQTWRVQEYCMYKQLEKTGVSAYLSGEISTPYWNEAINRSIWPDKLRFPNCNNGGIVCYNCTILPPIWLWGHKWWMSQNFPRWIFEQPFAS